MALRWIEGFETDQGTTDFQRKYAVVANSGSWNFGTGPKVGSMMQAGSNADAELRTKALVGSPGNTWIIGWRVRFSTLQGGFSTPGDRAGGITLFRGSSDQVEIRAHCSGDGAFSWRIYRGATLLGETETFWDNDWIYWEFKIVARTGTNGSVQIRRTDTYHGGTVTFFTLGSINTANSGTDGADVVRYKFQMGNNSSLDDFYINDDSGAAHNDYESGDVVVFGSSPNADGNRNQWVPSTAGAHWSLVNDPGGTPSDATKIKSQIPGDVDLFGYQNLALMSTGQTLLGIMLGTTGGMETSGSRTLRHVVRDTGGSEATGASFVWSTTPTQHQFEIFELNPVTSVAWTKAAIDAAEFGIELVS